MKEVKGLKAVLNFDGKLNTYVHSLGSETYKELQQLWFKAIDAIQKYEHENFVPKSQSKPIEAAKDWKDFIQNQFDIFMNGSAANVSARSFVEYLILQSYKAKDSDAVEKLPRKFFEGMLKNTPMKLVSYMLLVIARDLTKANSATTTIKQDMDVDDKRYTVKCKIEISEVKQHQATTLNKRGE